VRRRRLVIAAVGLAVLLLAFPPGGAHSSAAGSGAPAVRAGTVYTVRPGDSLWSIAERLDPTGDPRTLVQQMATDSGSYTIVPGERLSLP
jgi:LysM repeat protein